MPRALRNLAFVPCGLAIVAMSHAQPPVQTDEIDRVQKSIATLTDLATNEERGIPRELLQRAEAIVVIPSLVKGGFVVGAKHGRGVMSTRGPVTDNGQASWSAPAFVTVTGGSIGWQIGVQSVDLVLLVMTRKSVEGLLDNKFTLGGSASATAGPVGRTAEAQTDAKFASEILAYSRTSGLFAGATLEGAAFRADKDANQAFYGEPLGIRAITTSGPPRVHPSIAEAWQDALRDLTRRLGPSHVIQ